MINLHFFLFILDSNTTIGIVIAFITVYIGIWYSKRLKDKIKLTLISENWISLLTFQHKFKTLKISYEIPLKTNLFYYRATVFNSGNLDIDKNIVYSPLEVCIPTDCKVLECEIVNKSSEKFFLKKEYRENKMTFEWDLLKSREYFSFECIVESEKNYNQFEFQKNTITNQRISNIKEVEQLYSWEITASNIKDHWISSSFGYILLLLVLTIPIFGTYMGIKSFIKPDIEVNHEVIRTSDKKIVQIKPFSTNKVILYNNDYSDTVNAENLSNQIELRPLIDVKKNLYFPLIISPLMFLGVSVFIFRIIRKDIQEAKKIILINSFKSKDG